MKKNKILIWGIFFLGICCKKTEQRTLLQKIDVTTNIELDTLESHFDHSVLLVNIIRKGSFGRFTIDCGLLRMFKNESVLYEVQGFSPFRISKEYIGQVKEEQFGKVGFGWYNIQNKRVVSLPDEKKIIDSLKSLYSERFFVTSNGKGDFLIYDSGKVVLKLNYGNIVLKNTNYEFDSLDNQVLKLENNKLVKRMILPEDVISQENGIYYISRLGLGVLRKLKKKELFEEMMLFKRAKDMPKVIEITPYNPL